MLEFRLVLLSLTALVTSTFADDGSSLGSVNECNLVSFIGSYFHLGYVCDELFPGNSTAEVSGATSTSTLTVIKTSTIVQVENTNVKARTTSDIDITETKTSYIYTSTSTDLVTTYTKRDLDAKATSLALSSINFQSSQTPTTCACATAGLVARDFTLSSSDTSLSQLKSSALVASSLASGTSMSLITSIPSVISSIISGDLVDVKTKMESYNGTSYPVMNLSPQFTMEVESFCSCLTKYSNIQVTVVTETSIVTSYTTSASTKFDVITTSTTDSTTTTTTTGVAIKTINCENAVSYPDFQSINSYSGGWIVEAPRSVTVLEDSEDCIDKGLCLRVIGDDGQVTIKQSLNLVTGLNYTVSFGCGYTSAQPSLNYSIATLSNISVPLDASSHWFTITNYFIAGPPYELEFLLNLPSSTTYYTMGQVVVECVSEGAE